MSLLLLNCYIRFKCWCVIIGSAVKVRLLSTSDAKWILHKYACLKFYDELKPKTKLSVLRMALSIGVLLDKHVWSSWLCRINWVLAPVVGLQFFETSAKDNINVKAVFEKLVDIICDKMAESLDSDPNMIPNQQKGS